MPNILHSNFRQEAEALGLNFQDFSSLDFKSRHEVTEFIEIIKCKKVEYSEMRR